MKNSDGIHEMTGALSKKKERGANRLSVTRKKHFRDPLTGEVVAVGPNEIYLQHRRDYGRHPLTKKEQKQRAKWSEVCQKAQTIVKDRKHPRYMELYARWRAQLGSPKPRKQFANFVRAVLVKERSDTEGG